MTAFQCVPFSAVSVPKNGTKQTGRDSRAHKETGHVPSRFLSRFAPECPVSSVPFSSQPTSQPFTKRLAVQARRELLAWDLSQQDHRKAARISGLPLFEVAWSGRSHLINTARVRAFAEGA